MYSELKTLNTDVLAISTDSVYSHKVFAETSPSLSKVTYPLVSDRTHSISKAYQVLNEKTGAAYRATIIIDSEGKIVGRFINPSEVGRNSYEILRLIYALQFARQTGKGVPANWMPGNAGIDRDPMNIGKI
ncbi:alkyl hydroperoxide reductase [Bacillus sp. FJAT-18017]|nr:alkyl hydroperoxide reductase [Bacillus sp. FJAT-18017]